MGGSWRAAVRSFASVDRKVVAGDRLLLLVLTGIPLLVAVLRWLTGPGTGWIEARYGIELSSHLPAIVAFLVVVHVPTMLGSVIGLLFLEDRDAGLLPALATTRSTLSVLIAYRLTVAAVGAAASVSLGLLVSGVPHRAGPVATVVVGLSSAVLAPITAMLLAGLARDRAQGVAVMKAIGLPAYLPIAWWFVESPLGWVFALSPSAWPIQAYWATTVGETVLWAFGGTAIAAAVTALLIGRFRVDVI